MKASFSRVISGTFLISGTTIGAGMLGIPLVTGAAGFGPAFIVTSIVWLFMLITGLLFLEATLWMPDGSNILSMTGHFLGKRGKLFSGGMFVFLYYCLMIAYFAAGAPLLSDVFSFVFGVKLGVWQSYLVFGLLFGTIVAISPKSVDRANIILSVAMILSWTMLIGVGARDVETSRLTVTDWPKAFVAMPILFSAFGYHNVIPSLCSYLKRDVSSLRAAIILGTALPFVVYAVWQWLIIGMIPAQTIAETLQEGQPITVAFQTIIGAPWVVGLGRFFALFAIITSVLGVSFSMVDFLGDGMKVTKRTGGARIGLTLLVFLPSFAFASANPHIFDIALGVAGGFGEAYLNGLLPVLLVWIGRYGQKLPTTRSFGGGRVLLVILAAYSLFVMGLEAVHLFLSFDAEKPGHSMAGM